MWDCSDLASLRNLIGQENSRHLLIQSDAKLTQSSLDHSHFLAFKASFLHLLCIPWAPCESYLCLK